MAKNATTKTEEVEKKDSVGGEESTEETTSVDSPAENSSEVESPTVVVRKTDLEGFLKRLDTLEADNKRLIAVADKGRLANEKEREMAADGAPLVRTVKLTRLDSNKGPLVVAWKVTANESYVDGNRMVERQELDLYLQNGKTEHMRLLDFYRRQNKQTIAEIIKRSLNEQTGDTELEVELKDGERITIGLAFVN